MFRKVAAAAIAAVLGAGAASAQISGDVVRIGVLNDISGVFQDTNGPGSVLAAQMAAKDFAGGGWKIHVEVVQADHQNEAKVGSTIARRCAELHRRLGRERHRTRQPDDAAGLFDGDF